MEKVFHIATIDDWQSQIDQSDYQPSAYIQEGFIHCCTAEQIDYVLTTYFKGVKEIFLLKIDIALLIAELKVEPANGQHFPHIYGPINKNAVVDIQTISQ